MLSVVATFALLRPVLATSEPPVTSGGILLFVEGAQETPAASIDATIWRTGFPGISIVELKLQFEKPPLGAHWYAIASGQYQIPESAPLPAYCVYPGDLGPDGTVLCPRDELIGSAGARYRTGGLGAIDHDNRVRAIVDHEAYDEGTASVVEGTFTDAGRSGDRAASLTISLPIRSPRQRRAGSQTIGALAPIASYNQSDLGLNEDLGPVAYQTRGRLSTYAETATRKPLTGIKISSIRLTLREELNYKDVASSRPPVVSNDRLVWDNPEIRRDGVQYVLHDPVAANSQLVRTFGAGLTASIGFAFMLLLLEPLLRRKAGLSPS